MSAVKPESRPRCPACFGGGKVPHPLDEHAWLECSYCHGQGFNPYWMGPDQSKPADDAPCSTC